MKKKIKIQAQENNLVCLFEELTNASFSQDVIDGPHCILLLFMSRLFMVGHAFRLCCLSSDDMAWA